MEAWNGCVAPNSTVAVLVEIANEISLDTVTVALADFDESAWLVAVTCTAPVEGRSVGAI